MKTLKKNLIWSKKINFLIIFKIFLKYKTNHSLMSLKIAKSI